MDNLKKYYMVTGVVVLALIIVIASFVTDNYKRNYSLADFGVAPLLKPDCSSLATADANTPVTISLNAPNVSLMRDQVKALILKYNGHITSDSFNSYAPSAPVPLTSYSNLPAVASSQDSANINATFDKSQDAFLAELSSTVKSAGGVNSGYNYTDGTQPQYNIGYSSYTSCVNAMMNVSADILQLKVLTQALKEEHNTLNLALLSQSISTAKTTLQNDANSANAFFTTSNQPSVSISINALQK
jgi:hypothetical protein